MIFFTDNYQDRSTNDGYQFEFFWRASGRGGPAEIGEDEIGEELLLRRGRRADRDLGRIMP